MTVNDWLEISQMSGTGNAEVTLTASSYEELVERTATLKVKGASTDALISIKQNAFIPTISISERTLYASFFGETLTVTILSNANWSIDNSVLPEWITINDVSGEANVSKTLDIIVSENIGDLREVTIPIFITNKPTIILGEIKITQDAYDEEAAARNKYLWVLLEEEGEISGIKSSTIQYSYDRESWISFPSNGSITVPANTYVWFRNTSNILNYNTTDNSTVKFSVRGRVGGDLSSMGSMQKENFDYLFYKNENLTDASKLILPWDVLEEGCYGYMFCDCTSLTTAPELPSTTIAYGCYEFMFYGCTSLTTAPKLPAKTLAGYCYAYMFYGCTSLTNAPELPSTTLAETCYFRMFVDCTSLTTAPILPAATLEDDCYGYMFVGCTNLNYIKILATGILLNNFTYGWVQDVSPTGTFVKKQGASFMDGDSGIPDGWTIIEITE